MMLIHSIALSVATIAVQNPVQTAIDRLSSATEQVKTSVEDTASHAIEQAGAAGNQIVNRLSQTGSGVKASLVDNTLHKAEQLSGSVADSVVSSVDRSIQQWLDAHPVVGWLAVHPLISLGLFLLIVLLFASLLSAIVRLTQNVWIALLAAPWRLMQWLFAGITSLLRGVWGSKGSALPAAPEDDRLTVVLSRLESIQQEQKSLMQELKTLLGSKQ